MKVMVIKPQSGLCLLLMAFAAMLVMSGCSALHDGSGWEHTGDPVTHQDTQPYILEHDH